MTVSDSSEPFEMGRERGQEDGAAEPLTETQERNVRVLLRQADADTQPTRRKAS